jgi:hypothetical protein
MNPPGDDTRGYAIKAALALLIIGCACSAAAARCPDTNGDGLVDQRDMDVTTFCADSRTPAGFAAFCAANSERIAQLNNPNINKWCAEGITQSELDALCLKLADFNGDGKVDMGDKEMVYICSFRTNGTPNCVYCPGYNPTTTSITTTTVPTSHTTTTTIRRATTTTTATTLPSNDWCSGADMDMDGRVGATEMTRLAENKGRTDCSEENDWCDRADTNKDKAVDDKDQETFNANFGRRDCAGKSTAPTTTTIPKSVWCYGADANKDGVVDGKDIDIVVENWPNDKCTKLNDWCRGADTDKNGKVDKTDVTIVNKMKGTTGCGPFKYVSNSTTTTTVKRTTTTTQPKQTGENESDRGGGENWCNGADTDRDGKVDGEDLGKVVTKIGNRDCSASNGWCGGADTNKDKRVDDKDIQAISANIGKKNCQEASTPPDTTTTATTTTATTTSTLPKETCSDGRLNQGEEGVDCGGPCPGCQAPEASISLEAPDSTRRGKAFNVTIRFNTDEAGMYAMEVGMPQELKGFGRVIAVAAQGGRDTNTAYVVTPEDDAPEGEYTIEVTAKNSKKTVVARAKTTVSVEQPIVIDTPIFTVELPTAGDIKRGVHSVQERIYTIVNDTTGTTGSNGWIPPTILILVLGGCYFYVSRRGKATA